MLRRSVIVGRFRSKGGLIVTIRPSLSPAEGVIGAPLMAIRCAQSKYGPVRVHAALVRGDRAGNLVVADRPGAVEGKPYLAAW